MPDPNGALAPQTQPYVADPLGGLESQGSQYSWQGDLGHQVAAGVGSLGAALSSAVGWVADVGSRATNNAPGWAGLSDAMDSWRQATDAFASGNMNDLSPTAQSLMSAPIMSGLTGNPMMYIAGNIAQMAPSLVATITATALTGGLADVLAGGAAAGASAGAAASTATGFGLWGGITAGDAVNQIYTAVDNVPDDKLQQTNPLYKQYRDKGMSEAQARKAYRVDVAGVAPAVAFAVGGLAGIVGGPGQLSRAFGSDVAGALVDTEGKNLLQRTAIGAGVGAGVGAVQGAASDALTQLPLDNAGLKPFDGSELVNAALSGGIMGGIMGGVAEGPLHGLTSAPAAKETASKSPKTAKAAAAETVDPVAPDAAQTLAMDGAQQKAPAAAVAQPEPAPVTRQPPVQPEQPAPAPAPEATATPEPVAAPEPVATPEPVAAPETQPAAPATSPQEPAPVQQSPVETAPREPAPVQQPPVEVAPAGEHPLAPVLPEPAAAQTPNHDTLFATATKTTGTQAALNKIAELSGVPLQRVTSMLKDSTAGRDIASIRDAIKQTLDRAKETYKAPGAKHRTADEIQVRQDANDTAQEITATLAPNPEVEGNAIGSANNPGVKEARVALGKRVTAMADAAEQNIAKPLVEQGSAFPTRFKDNANSASDWNEHIMLLSEARRLAQKIRNKTATSSDYERFLTREADLRKGNVSAVKADRRAEGDMAFRKGVVDTTGDVAAKTPEAAAGTDFEASAERVTTKVSKSTKRPISEGTTGAASEVREVELTPEQKAKIEARANATKEQPPAPEPKPTERAEPKATSPKVEKAKATAKARAAAKDSKPKVGETVKARIAAAAKQVDRNPTDAQKESGTYQKGHVSVHGLDITIENPKGSTRSGVGPDGTQWSVKMPDHYGYIKRTAGADGDHVDVYIGPHPESEHVFLVEQRNPDTGAFDEHKAMLGYDNVAQAAQAYDRAFSDGRAADRFGSVKPMSVDAFKTWLKEGDTTKPTDEYRATQKALAETREKIPLAQTRGEPSPFVKARNAVASMLNAVDDRGYHELEERWLTSEGNPEHLTIAQSLDEAAGPREALELGTQLKAMHDELHPTASAAASHMADTRSPARAGGESEDLSSVRRSSDKAHAWVRARAVRTMDGATALKQSSLVAKFRSTVNASDRLLRGMVPMVADRLKALVGHVPVHILSDADFVRVSGNERSMAFFDPAANYIVVRQSVYDNSEQMPHTIAHEMVHAAFMNATYNNAGLRDIVHQIAIEAHEHGAEHFGGEYALTNVDEFIAEAFSNPEFQNFLATVKAPQPVKEYLGLTDTLHTMWDALVEVARRALGLPSATGSLLHAMMRVGDELTSGAVFHGTRVDDHALLRKIRASREQNASLASHITSDALSKTLDDVKAAVEQAGHDLESAITGKGTIKQMPAPKLMSVQTFDQIAAKAGRYFQGNPVRKVFNAVEGIRVSAMKTMRSFEPELLNLHKMADKYRGPVFDDFAQLMHDSTMAGVFPSKELSDPENAHVSKQGYTDEWQRAMHGELKAQFDALPKDLQDTYERTAKFFRDTQNKMALSTIENRVLVALGIEDKGLASRVFNDTATEDDKKLLGPAYDVVKQAGALSKIDGPYFPLMRRGDYAVTGEYDVKEPTSPSYLGRTSDGKYEFTNKDEAAKFAAHDETGAVRAIRPTLRSTYVDSRTGLEYGVDENGERVKITPQDTFAQQRFRVGLQNKHVEFVDSRLKAAQLAHDLQQRGLKNVDYQEKLFQPNSPRGDMLSAEAKAVMQIIEKRDAYAKMTPEQQHEVQQALTELSLRYLGSTRISSRALPRRYVAGASKDVVRNTYDYAQSTSSYLGKLQHAPEIDKAIEEMRAQTVGDYGKDTSLGRSAIYNEVMKRVTNFTPIAGDSKAFSAVSKRFMVLSYLDKLLSPSHSVVNAMQTPMLTFPTMSGRHGIGSTFRALSKAYDDIGALSIAKGGLKKTLEHAAKPTTADLATFVEDAMARIKNAGERSMVQFLVDHGSVDPDAGFEINRLISASNGIVGKFDTGLNYLDGIARQMPRAVETINRLSAGLAAYRLELAKTGSHDAAVNYAQEVVNMTHGVYSSTNAAPIFNHPLARLSLQFKKYGQMVYGLLGHQIGKAVLNAQPGDRAEAIKTLGTLAAMHIAVAGTLGLPTEPFKWLLLGAHFAGLTEYNWADVENWERQVLSSVAGRGAGEVLARGVTRMLPGGLAFDLSQRVGLQDLMTFGEPKSTNPNDLSSYLWQLAAGAPGSLAMDYLKGVQALTAGNFEQAANLMIPMKAASDAIGAVQKMSQGKVTKSGNQYMTPYSLQEALVRTFGFTPEREAENSDAQSAFYNANTQLTAQRQGLQQQWFQANPSQRMRLWGQVEQFNKGVDPAQRLTRAQLDNYVRLRNHDVTTGRVTNGLHVTPQNRTILNQVTQTYNG